MYLEIALKYKVKQSKNGKFPPNAKAGPIPIANFPPYISPSEYTPLKKGLLKIKAAGLSEFYGISNGTRRVSLI